MSLVSTGPVKFAGGDALTGEMIFDKAGVLGPREYNLPYSEGGHFETVAGELLNLEVAGGADVDGHITYQEVLG